MWPTSFYTFSARDLNSFYPLNPWEEFLKLRWVRSGRTIVQNIWNEATLVLSHSILKVLDFKKVRSTRGMFLKLVSNHPTWRRLKAPMTSYRLKLTWSRGITWYWIWPYHIYYYWSIINYVFPLELAHRSARNIFYTRCNCMWFVKSF